MIFASNPQASTKDTCIKTNFRNFKYICLLEKKSSSLGIVAHSFDLRIVLPLLSSCTLLENALPTISYHFRFFTFSFLDEGETRTTTHTHYSTSSSGFFLPSSTARFMWLELTKQLCSNEHVILLWWKALSYTHKKKCLPLSLLTF